MSMNSWIKIGATACLLGCFATGCAWQIGGDKAAKCNQPTKGQELIDLKKARDVNAISEAEYETQKQQVMHR
jgi:hypothetical protein